MPKLKIAEQILIVLFIAAILPLIITALIVTNVNQQAVRKELRYSAYLTTNSVYQHLLSNIEEKKLSLLYVSKSLKYINSSRKINEFINEIFKSSNKNLEIKLVNYEKKSLIPDFSNSNIDISQDIEKNKLIMYAKVTNNKCLREIINLKELEKDIFKHLTDNKRQVYVVDSNNNIVMSYNKNLNDFKILIDDLPKKYKIEQPELFGRFKNQPNIYLKLKEPNWAIIVTTPKKLTTYGIVNARYKIILALIVAAFTIIVLGALYSLSLYTNIKQLFRAIAAISKGNYKKRVRLIRNFFTPYEVIYLSDAFNKMVGKIDSAYKKLQKANIQLEKMDKIRSNLIDTVSHEFRTPLTSIKGYTSRLLRNDINVDEETKIKSLKVIKQQTERLSRLVEDLLVIPDIESSVLRVFPDEINLKEILEDCILSIQHKQTRTINLSMENNFPTIYADPGRLEQVIINLLENAIKYSPENSEILIKVEQEENFAVIKVFNEGETVPEAILNTLFNKFTRLDNDLTRTTRGTGLGLFIAKGLIKAMGGQISIFSERGFEVKISLPIKTDNSSSLNDDDPVVDLAE